MKVPKAGAVCVLATTLFFSGTVVYCGAEPSNDMTAAATNVVAAPSVSQPFLPAAPSALPEFLDVAVGSGVFGMIVWIGLFATAFLTVYWSVDSAILIQERRMMPWSLVRDVANAARDGNVMKALEACEKDPSPFAKIITAAFSRVEEKPEIIQEAVAIAADAETERLSQKLTWISVMSNIAPMLGLLGTVQGMIMAFKTISISTPDPGLLSMAIAQALWTTAAGLVVAIPAITLHYVMKNKTNTMVLRMETMAVQMARDFQRREVVPQ
jgi:biopolymer transport protein ExbB